MNEYECLTWELYDKTRSKLIKEYINRDYFDIILLSGSAWYIEHQSHQSIWDQLYENIKNEMKRIFPYYKYLYD